MIKKVFHLADIHIPNNWDKNRPYDEMLIEGLRVLRQEIGELNEDEFRIVVSGDIFDAKVKPTPEARHLFVTFLNCLNHLGETIIIAGNHDMIMSNKSRMDSISPLFALDEALPNITYMDALLNKKSGCVVDDNIVWCLYSMFDDFKTPEDLKALRETYPTHKFVGLYHGTIVGAKNDCGFEFKDGLPYTAFNGCDCVMMGHIHKYQEIKQNGIPFVYPSSLIQQNFGENTTNHGFVVWDMEAEPTLTHRFVEVGNEYRLFKFKITSYDDINEDIEKLMNL